MATYGIAIDSSDVNNQTITFYSEDPVLVDAEMTLYINNGVTEEPDWYDQTKITANIFSNTCSIRSAYISDVAGNPQYELSAIQTISTDSVDYSSMIDLANEALRYELYNFLCGEIEYDLVYGEGVDSSILRMDKEN